jgi:protoporphyrinogen/coproporphyrinogen III oxidase
MTERVDLAVVGGGISGLAAAWEARQRGARVVVLEAGKRAGGKLQTSALAGSRVDLDEAADAFLARVPDAIELCDELGLAAELVSPATGAAYVWLDGALRRLPTDQLLGVPTDLDAAAGSGLLSAEGAARARLDLTLPDDRPAGRGGDGDHEGVDESVGALVRRRLGAEVLDRLVAPLVGSIYAGDCDRLSLQVSAAQLAAARDRDPADPSLIRAAAALRAAAVGTGRPVFLAPAGGMGRLADALADRLGDDLRTGTAVTGLSTDGGGHWRLDGTAGPIVTADAVVLAIPAFATAPLLAQIAPEAAAFLSGIDHASVALVSLAVPRAGIDRALDGSGFLVPRSAGLLVTACSWVTSKWAHLAVDPSVAVLRASVGHAGDDRGETLPDDVLVAGVVADLGTTMGLRAGPTDVRISRWPRSFPQPRPGHLAAVDAAERAVAAVAPRLAVTGAWARGVGVPACIRGGRAAAARVLGATTAA